MRICTIAMIDIKMNYNLKFIIITFILRNDNFLKTMCQTRNSNLLIKVMIELVSILPAYC